MLIEKRVEKLNKVRHQGLIPGVLFGKEFGTNSISIMVKPEEFFKAYSKYGKTKTFKIKLDGETHDVYFKDIEKNIMKANDIVHFSLLKVSKGDKVSAKLQIKVLGENEVEKLGMIVVQSLHEIEVEYPIGAEVSSLHVNVTDLQAGDSVHVKDIKLPDGFKLFLHPEDVVATVTYPKVQKEPEPKPETVENPEQVTETEN